MKWLRKFENFKIQDYKEEIDYLINSFLEIEDNWSLSHIERDDERIRKSYNFILDENSYYFTENVYSGCLEFNFVAYIYLSNLSNATERGVVDMMIRPNEQMILENIENEYNGLISDIKEFVKISESNITNMDNDVQSNVSYRIVNGWTVDYPRERRVFASIIISFEIIQLELKRRERDKSVEKMLKSIGGWSDVDIKKFKELGYNLDENLSFFDFQHEIDYLKNSFLDISDEYDLSEISINDPKLSYQPFLRIDENCYYHRHMSTNKSVRLYIGMYIRIDEFNFNKFTYNVNSKIKEFVDDKYPNFSKNLEKWYQDSIIFLKNIYNKLEYDDLILFQFRKNHEGVQFCFIEVVFEIVLD